MPTDTRFTAALATEQDARWPGGIKPNGEPVQNAANDAAVASRREERKHRNPHDEFTYLATAINTGRTAEDGDYSPDGIPTLAAIATLAGYPPVTVTDTAPNPVEAASEPHRASIAQRYARAEAASAVVKAAREWMRWPNFTEAAMVAETNLADAVTAYERLLEEGE